MGDTYGRIIEKRDIFSTIQRTQIYADYLFAVKFDLDLYKGYVYVVRPVDLDQNAEWEGGISSIKKKISKATEQNFKEIKLVEKKIN